MEEVLLFTPGFSPEFKLKAKDLRGTHVFKGATDVSGKPINNV